jgi:protein translocase SecG subunit
MTSLFVGLLTVALIGVCLLLILLVLVQLPKKDAGAGLAFGSGAADALFGAGSGNALTKITKYATITFLAMSLILGYLWDKVSNTASAGSFANQVAAQQQKQMSGAPTAQTPTPTASTVPQMTTNAISLIPASTTSTIATTNSAK